MSAPTIREMRLVQNAHTVGLEQNVLLKLSHDVDGKIDPFELHGIPRAIKSHPTDESTYFILLETTGEYIAITYNVLERQCSFIPYTLRKWKQLLDRIVPKERCFDGKPKR